MIYYRFANLKSMSQESKTHLINLVESIAPDNKSKLYLDVKQAIENTVALHKRPRISISDSVCLSCEG